MNSEHTPELGWRPRYGDWREGLKAVLAAEG